MKAASVREIKQGLQERTPAQLIELCLQLAKFKKDNKELLTYLLFEAQDEDQYIETVKKEMTAQFGEVNTRSYYFIKKSVRKILRDTKKHIRYSKKKETEVELLIHFCLELKSMKPSAFRSSVLRNLYARQLAGIRKAMARLHEDLQYDYQQELEYLLNGS